MTLLKVYARHTVNLDASAYLRYLKLWKDGEVSRGDDVIRFEKAFGTFIGAKACVAAASARAAFYVTLKAMNIEPGDEVILPAYTFPSMPAAVIAAGGKPVFVDVDPETYNIDPVLAGKAITKRTQAIVAAHLFGRSADVEALSKIAREADIYLVEDAAHAAGALSGGKRVGSFGDAAVFSFGIGKNMPCFGGGAVTFKDVELAGRVRKTVNSFSPPDGFGIHKTVLKSVPSWLLTRKAVFPWTLYVAARVLDTISSTAMDRSVEEPLSETTRFTLRSVGRISNLQAAVGLDQLEKLPERNAVLARNGAYLAKRLSDIPTVKAPEVLEGEEHIYLYFRILVPEAPKFRFLLRKRGIDTQRDDMANCAGLEEFSQFTADCPVAAGLPEKSIELPNNTSLSKGDLDYIASAVREVADIISGGDSTARSEDK